MMATDGLSDEQWAILSYKLHNDPETKGAVQGFMGLVSKGRSSADNLLADLKDVIGAV